MFRASAYRLSSVAFELGRMVQHCNGRLAMKESYSKIFSRKSGGIIGQREQNKSDDPRIMAPRIIGIDCEMILCRQTRRKIPIVGAMEESVWYDGVFHRFQTEWKIDNGIKLTEDGYDWKSESHGITYQSFHKIPAEQLTSLSEVQSVICNVLSHPNSVIVGHMLETDLESLCMGGDALRAKVIDTAYLFPQKFNGGAQSLRAIARNHLKDEVILNKLQRKGPHDPLIDSQAVVRIVEEFAMGSHELPEGEIRESNETFASFLVPTSAVSMLIGKGGENFKSILKETGSMCSVSTSFFPTKNTRLLVVESKHPFGHETALKKLRTIAPDKMLKL